MRTIEIYKYDELSEEAKKAVRDSIVVEDHWFDERKNSFHKAQSLFYQMEDSLYENFNSDDYDGKFDYPELTGVRLYKWIINNMSYKWMKKHHISKHTDESIKNDHWSWQHDCVKQRLSQVFETDNLEGCFMTGYCDDITFLKPLIDFMKKPSDSVTMSDFLNNMPTLDDVTREEIEAMENDIEYLEGEIYNMDAEYLVDGRLYTGV